MILVDTSVWIDYFREGDSDLVEILNVGLVSCHPFIVGEIACGNLKDRIKVLSLLSALPVPVIAENDEVLKFIEKHNLMGRGLGYIDMHLLVSAVLSRMPLWTLDRRLAAVAGDFNLRYSLKLC